MMPPQWSIANAIYAYQYQGGYYLPILELAEAYEFFVESEVDRAFVSGFAGREENSFVLDGERGEIIVKGVSEALPVDSIIPPELVPEGDLYIRIDVLNRLWPVEMTVNLPTITIIAEAEEELSFIRRKERENRQAMYAARETLRQKGIKELPYVENKYRWIGKPVLDLQTNYTYDNDIKQLRGGNSISGTQQLGKMIADYSANFNYLEGQLRQPDSIRMRLMRQAPESEDLYFPGLKRLELGDISLSQRGLIGNSAGGRGMTVSNTSTSQVREFDRITVEGRGPPGWEFEYYNNNQLLGFGAVDADATYTIEDIVLNYGLNRIRVILYGPQGQIREDVYEYDVGRNLLSPGEFKYKAGFVDTDRPFIRLQEPDPSEPDPVLTQAAEAYYGLNRWLTVFGSYTRTPLRDEEEQYFSGGAAVNTPVGMAEVEGYRNINGGKAVDMRFITELLGIQLNTRAAFFRQFESQYAGFGTGARRFEGEMQANTGIKLPFLPKLDLRFRALHRELRNDTKTTNIDLGQSFTGAGIRFNHTTSSRFMDGEHLTTTGGLNLNYNKRTWRTRSNLNYNIYPEFELDSLNSEIRYRPPDDFQAALTFQHDFIDSTSGIGGQIGYDFGDILSTADAQYIQERGWLFTLRASTSLNPYYADRSYKLSSSSRKNLSPALARVFLDHDGSGTFTEGDEPIEGANLNVDRARARESTNEEGYAVVSLRNDAKSNISLDEASLQDPYFRVATAGYSTLGLRGSMPAFDFPVMETGAIDGTVWREPSGRPVSGMNIELVRPDGTVVMTAQTSFDGYYTFEFVLPGTYTVRADPIYQVNVPPETVEVSSDEIFVYGVDLYLLEPAAEESAAEEPDGESGEVAQTDHAPAVHGTEQPAPLSLPDEGSALILEETTDEDVSPAAESSAEEGRSLPGEGDSGGGAPSFAAPAAAEMPADVPVTASVKDIRIGEHPDKTRVVLELSQKVAYEIKQGDSGLVVVVDIPAARWQAKASDTLDYNLTLKGFGTETLPNGGTRLLLVARENMRVRAHEVLPAQNGQGPRLYIDVERPLD